MVRIFKHYIPTALIWLGIIEGLLLLIAVRAALIVRYWIAEISVPAWQDGWVQVILLVTVSYVVMLSTGLYMLETCRDFRLSLMRLFVSMIISALLMSVILFSIPEVDLWRSVIFLSYVFAYIVFIISRFSFLHIVDLSRFKNRVLVLGAGERADLVRVMGAYKSSHVFFVDFLSMTDKEAIVPNSRKFQSIKDFPAFVEKNSVHEIVVAIQERRGNLPLDVLLKSKIRVGCKITEAADFIEKQSGLVKVDSISPGWLVFSDGFGGLKSNDFIVKRLFDIVASSFLLLFTLPIIFFTAILIKLTSKGPIFYKQRRVGLNSKLYYILKFRSMSVNAESDGIPKMADENDVRVTFLGRFIRTTRIDEIPQIFNVLKGDMSFVGPRPERPFFVSQFNSTIPYYHQRHVIKPGITGWAQLNYSYGASEEDSRMKLEYDLYYIKNYSLFLDIIILIQTVRVILWPNGVR